MCSHTVLVSPIRLTVCPPCSANYVPLMIILEVTASNYSKNPHYHLIRGTGERRWLIGPWFMRLFMPRIILESIEGHKAHAAGRGIVRQMLCSCLYPLGLEPVDLVLFIYTFYRYWLNARHWDKCVEYHDEPKLTCSLPSWLDSLLFLLLSKKKKITQIY